MTDNTVLEMQAGDMNLALSTLLPVLSKRSKIPFMNAVKIDDGKATATDLDMEVTVTVPKKGDQPESLCFPLPSITRLLKHVDSDEDIIISKQDDTLAVLFNGSNYSLYKYDAREFPAFVWNESGAKETIIDNVGLLSALKSVFFALSNDELRPYLNGVCFSRDANGSPVVVSTDGHRMAIKQIPVMPEGFENVIVPRKTVAYLTSRGYEPWSCKHSQERVRFSFSGLTVTSRLIVGTYPDWKRLYPHDAPVLFSIETIKLFRIVKRLQAFSKGRPIAFTIGEGKIELDVSLADIGIGRETIVCETFATTGGNDRFGLNSHYLIDILNEYKGCETVTFSQKTSEAPILIHSDDSDLRCIQMPMRV